jgi:hypothetical protein
MEEELEHKQKTWSSSIENVIKTIATSCKEYKYMNLEACRKATLKYDIIMYSLIMIGPISSIITSVYAHSCDGSNSQIVQIFLYLLSGVLSSLIKFSRLEHQATLHRAISVKFASLESNIERQLSLDVGDRQTAGKYLDWVSHSFNELFNSSPIIVETVYQKWLKQNIKDIEEKHVTIKSEEKGEFEIEPNNFNDGNMRYEISRLQSK